MFNQKNILLALIITSVIGIAILAYIRGKKQIETKLINQEPVPIQSNNNSNNNSNTNIVVNSNYPIIYNQYNEAAKPLQAALNVVADGIFGQKSLTALKVYYPSFTENFAIKNEAVLKQMIEFIKTQKQKEAQININKQNEAAKKAALDRSKTIFNQVKNNSKILQTVETGNYNLGVFDYAFVFYPNKNTITLPANSTFDKTRLVSYSGKYIYVKSNTPNVYIQLRQEVCIAK